MGSRYFWATAPSRFCSHQPSWQIASQPQSLRSFTLAFSSTAHRQLSDMRRSGTRSWQQWDQVKRLDARSCTELNGCPTIRGPSLRLTAKAAMPAWLKCTPSEWNGWSVEALKLEIYVDICNSAFEPGAFENICSVLPSHGRMLLQDLIGELYRTCAFQSPGSGVVDGRGGAFRSIRLYVITMMAPLRITLLTFHTTYEPPSISWTTKSNT